MDVELAPQGRREDNRRDTQLLGVALVELAADAPPYTPLEPVRHSFRSLQVISTLGNPVLWYGSTLAVVAGIVEAARRLVARKPIADDPRPDTPRVRVPAAALDTGNPDSLHLQLPSYAFALMALVYWLVRLWKRPPWGPWVVVAFTALALAATILPPPRDGAPAQPRGHAAARLDGLVVLPTAEVP